MGTDFSEIKRVLGQILASKVSPAEAAWLQANYMIQRDPTGRTYTGTLEDLGIALEIEEAENASRYRGL